MSLDCPTTATAQRKVLAKIARALRKTEDRGATPEEAAAAAEVVQRLLQDHNLTLSMVSDDEEGGPSSSPRIKNATYRLASFDYQKMLMRAVAESSFCLARTHNVLHPTSRRVVVTRHLLIGRPVNVEATLQTYDYLLEALSRAATDANYVPGSRRFTTFLTGAAERVAERLAERRRAAEEESRRSTNGSGRELIVLEDVYGSEWDLNNDVANNYPLGTTANRRRAEEARRVAQEACYGELVAGGEDPTVARYMSWGYERAVAVSIANPKPQKGRQPRYRAAHWTKADREAFAERRSAAFSEGRAAGNFVGLDGQVERSPRKLIGG